MTTPIFEAFDAGQLLRIDVGAELRKLAAGQLQGPWQIPTELVRRAIARGATRVNVEFRGKRVVVAHDGRPLDQEARAALVTLLTDRGGEATRHAALARLETDGELALLAICSLSHRTLLVECATDKGGVRVHHDTQRTWVEPFADRALLPHRERIALASANLDIRRASHWLRNMSRFAGNRVFIHGRAPTDPFAGAVGVRKFTEPRQGIVALPRSGQFAHVWLLSHGIVSDHVAVQDAPCFEAAVEFGDVDDGLQPAKLRAALNADLGSIALEAARLVVARSHQSASEAARARLAEATLRFIRRDLAKKELAKVRVFRAVTVGGAPTRCSVADLLRGLETTPTGRRTIVALDPAALRRKRAAVAQLDHKLPVLDDRERSLLLDLLDIRTRAPELPDPPTLAQRFRARWHAMADRIKTLWTTLGVGRSHVIAQASLSLAERAFLQRTREAIALPLGFELVFGSGSGAIHRQGKRIVLPRDNGDVRLCMRAVATDATAIYPVVRWLRHFSSVSATPSKVARERWLEPQDTSTPSS